MHSRYKIITQLFCAKYLASIRIHILEVNKHSINKNLLPQLKTKKL